MIEVTTDAGYVQVRGQFGLRTAVKLRAVLRAAQDGWLTDDLRDLRDELGEAIDGQGLEE